MRRTLTVVGSRMARVSCYGFSTFKPLVRPLRTIGVWRPIRYNFGSGPNQEIVTMPALSPTMSQGKIIKWSKKVGDKINQGDLLCEVETDKATVDFQTNSEGYLAKIVKNQGQSAQVGQEVAIIVQNEEDIKNVSSSGSGSEVKAKQAEGKSQKSKKQEKPKKEDKSKKEPKSKESSDKESKKNADQQGQTEEATKKERDNDRVDKKDNDKADKKDKKQVSQKQEQKEEQQQTQEEETEQKQSSKKQQKQDSKGTQKRIIASPLAKNVAQTKGIKLDGAKGSGPGGRIIEQDVDQLVTKAKEAKEAQRAQKTDKTPKTEETKSKEQTQSKKPSKFVAPQNPFQQTPLTGMRKTIAARLLESKSTIPHYYISVEVEMDQIEKLRSNINSHEAQNGVKVTVNDFVLKAAALALRDYPAVNVQWGENSIRQYKYSDVSMAVSTQSGLITPIIYRAEGKGLIQIAKEAKDLAKKARQNKLQPSEFVGGTISVSNAGMYGLSQMISVINPPQAIILGVAKAEKKVLYDPKAQDPAQPFRVASVMTVWASVDHRLVDGALSAQYLSKVKKYLQNPINMIL